MTSEYYRAKLEQQKIGSEQNTKLKKFKYIDCEKERQLKQDVLDLDEIKIEMGASKREWRFEAEEEEDCKHMREVF